MLGARLEMPMSEFTTDPRLSRAAPKKPLTLSWSDPRVRNIVWQAVVLGIVALLILFLVSNTQRNLAARHIATGFDFLDRVASIPIGEHILAYDPAINDYGRALIIGLLNTLRVAMVGIFFATILGTIVGVGRLSKNWLIAKLTAVYVEVVRDIPVLLQLLFWYTVLQGLPVAKQSFHPLPGVFLSNRGFKIPLVEWEQPFWWALLALVIGAGATWAYSKAATRKQEATGVRPKIWPVALGFLAVLPVAVWAVLGAPWQVDWPQQGGFNITGGATLSPEYFALTFGLTVYTAAYIAEIVRSGILAVPSGQWEAAGAIGLRPGTVLRKIVLPQALRVIIPPMTSQYLNLTKNSSLAVAIGFQDLVSITQTTLNQTGQAIEGVFTSMVPYLIISLSISGLMNWYNARIALVER